MSILKAFAICFSTAALVAIGQAQTLAEENPLLPKLVERGIKLSSGATLKLPQPTLPDGLDAAAQRAAVEQVAERYGYDRFTRDSVVAPLVLDMESIKAADGKRTGQTADLWFVAHGSIAALKDQKLLDELAEGPQRDGEGAEMKQLPAEVLKKRGIEPVQKEALLEGYQYFNMPLLDRVQLRGVSYAIKTESDESITITSVLDPRFNDDPQYANQWLPIDRNNLGETILGEPSPYQAYGGYAKITPLKEPAGAIFIELHVVFEEPQDWFRGANLLRSKMPVGIQDSVRKFRRKFSKVSEELAGKNSATSGE